MKVKRRDMLASLAAGVAGAVAAPRAGGGEPALDAQQAPAAGAPAEALPRLLDDQGRALLADLSDRIVPGARVAGVPDLIDRVLAVEPAQAKRRFLNALGAFEREARDRYGKGWLEITENQQLDILRAASTLASTRTEPPPWTRGQPVEPPASVPAPPANLRDHFDHVKDWVRRAYATTEPGMNELGFTGRMSFPTFPGCPHPGNDHT